MTEIFTPMLKYIRKSKGVIMSIAQKIQALRKEKGWSQGDLAKKLGYLQPHVNRWEKGKKYPSVTALKKLAKLFNVSIDILVYDEKDLKNLRIEDRTLLNKLEEFDKLSTAEKQSVITIIDTILKSKKTI